MSKEFIGAVVLVLRGLLRLWDEQPVYPNDERADLWNGLGDELEKLLRRLEDVTF